MANHSPDDIGEVDRATLRGMAEKDLTPELCALFLHHLDELPATAMGVDDPTDPIDVFHKMCRLSAHGCVSEVKNGVAKAILDNKTPVDVFFNCLSTPEDFERFLYGKDSTTDFMFKLSCKHAVQSFKALKFAHGEEEMIEMFRDPVLDELFIFTNRAARDDVTENNDNFHRRVLDELISIGSAIRRVICTGCSTELTIHQTLVPTKAFMYATKVDMEDLGLECQNKACPFYTKGSEKVPGTASPKRHPAYNEDTCRLLAYLSWLSHGRKDSEYTSSFSKLWDTVHPAELGSPPDPDLSRLPLGFLDEVRRTSCPDTKSLHRRATLFCIVLKQFILTTTGAPLPLQTVILEDGIIKATLDRLNYSYENCRYAGIAPSVRLPLPEVQGALHASCCREMLDPAKVLFDYFFLDTGAQIEFWHFVAKNVHTPVVKTQEGRPRSNMIPIHTVAVLTTKSGLQYVLDPTAPQYGWSEILAPLDVYTRCRVDYKLSTEDFAPLDPKPLPTEKTPKPAEEEEKGENDRQRRRRVAEYALEQVKGEIPNGDLGGVIDLPQDEFDKYCLRLDNTLAFNMGDYSKRNLYT